MRRWLVAVAAVTVLTACGGGGQPATSSSASTPSSSSSTRAGDAELLAGLGKIDPALNAPRSVARAENVCADITAGKPAATVRANARARFEGGSVASLTDEQAQQVVDVIRSTMCPQ